MRLTRWPMAVIAASMLLTACGSDSSGGETASGGSVGPTSSAVSAASTATSSAGASSAATASNAGQSVDVGGRDIYLDCRGTAVDGDPTIILVSGYHDSSDVWNQTDVLSLIGPAVGPPVQEALAAAHRVCSYDRPGTLRYIEGVPLTDRSTPVSQPRTAAAIVEELHTVLAAAAVPKPYVLVGHSFGGLIVRLYGQTYPDQTKGIVFVDAFSPTVPTVFGPEQWAIYRDQLLNPPLESAPLESLRGAESERIDLDASTAEVLAAPALPAIPLAVLTKTESFGGLTSVPGLPADVTNSLYEQAQDEIVALALATPHIIAKGSDHYIQFSQPDLVVAATELVFGRALG